MNHEVATTKRNIELLTHLIRAIRAVMVTDRNIITVYPDAGTASRILLLPDVPIRDFFDKLDLPFVIQERDCETYPWRAVADYAGIEAFVLLTADQYHREFNFDDCNNSGKELEAQVEAEEREYLTRLDDYEFEPDDPMELELEAWAMLGDLL